MTYDWAMQSVLVMLYSGNAISKKLNLGVGISWTTANLIPIVIPPFTYFLLQTNITTQLTAPDTFLKWLYFGS